MMRSLAILAVVLAAAALVRPASPALAGGTCHKGQRVSDATTASIAMAANCFSPTVARIEAGATVTWTNEDEVAHAVAGAAVSWGGYDEMPRGATFSQTFEEPGVYPYYCVIHPGMVGAIVVGDGQGDGEARIGSGARDASLGRASADAPGPRVTSEPAATGGGNGSRAAWLGAGALAGAGAAAFGSALVARNRRVRQP
jgi:plastocyanin